MNKLKKGDEAMIKNDNQIQEIERELIKKEKTNLVKNFQLVDAMYQEVVELGIMPMKNPLDGLEIDIKIAEVVNHVPGVTVKNSNSTE